MTVFSPEDFGTLPPELDREIASVRGWRQQARELAGAHAESVAGTSRLMDQTMTPQTT